MRAANGHVLRRDSIHPRDSRKVRRTRAGPSAATTPGRASAVDAVTVAEAGAARRTLAGNQGVRGQVLDAAAGGAESPRERRSALRRGNSPAAGGHGHTWPTWRLQAPPAARRARSRVGRNGSPSDVRSRRRRKWRVGARSLERCRASIRRFGVRQDLLQRPAGLQRKVRPARAGDDRCGSAPWLRALRWTSAHLRADAYGRCAPSRARGGLTDRAPALGS
jgi:hypothetical protein